MPSEVAAPHRDDPAAPALVPPTETGTAHPGSCREVDALAKAVRALHHRENRGDLAALRRMDASRATAPAFHRALAESNIGAARERAQRLALLTKILALATSAETLRNGRQSLGAALRAADVSEARVQMLMTARGDALDELLLRTARRLVRDGMLPYEDIGKLILGGPKAVEDTRFRIAKAYWAHRVPIPEDKRSTAKSEPASGDDE